MRITQRITAVVAAAIMLASFALNALGAAPVKGSEVAAFALKHDGYDYQYASKGPKKFDCSGFVYYVLGNFGIDIGGTTSSYNTREKAKKFGTVFNDMDEAKPGDIVIWKFHVSIYIGDGKCISALNANDGVCIRSVEKFRDQNGNKNPDHFFLRPAEYVDETEVAETEEPVTEAEEKKPVSFTKIIDFAFEPMNEFFARPFKPFVNLFE